MRRTDGAGRMGHAGGKAGSGAGFQGQTGRKSPWNQRGQLSKM